MMSSDVFFACSQCGKVIHRPSEKIGVPVACSQCRKTNYTPGWALQVRATWPQHQAMVKTTGRLRILLLLACGALAAFAMVFYLLLVLGDIPDQLLVRMLTGLLLIVVGAQIALLAVGMRARWFLGASKGALFVAFFCAWPAFLIIMILTFFHLRTNLRRLQAAGFREPGSPDAMAVPPLGASQ